MFYPRVTEILRPYSGYGHVDKQVLERAAEKGTAVHALCSAMAQGVWLPESMITEELKGYVKSFEKWKDAQVEEFLIVEKRFIDEQLGYTGQLDYVVRCTDKEFYLIDIKTSSSHQKTYALQMGAYYGLLKLHNIEVKSAFIVYLNKEGEFPDIYVVDDLEKEFYVFQKMLTCWYYFKEKNKNVRKLDKCA